MLTVPEVNCSRLSSALSVLEQLKTLCISVAKTPEQQVSGALELTALKALRSVRLDELLPESTTLGDRCELHLVTHSDGLKIVHPVWDTVLPHLRSLLLDDNSSALMGMPNVFYKAENLVKATLWVNHIGTASVPVKLHGALARVEELHVQCRDLHAIVPSDVAWRNINLTVRNVLDLRFEAVLSFAETIPAFCFRYRHLEVSYSLTQLRVALHLWYVPYSAPNVLVQGPHLIELAAILARRYLEWKGHFRDNSITSGVCFPVAQPPCGCWGALDKCSCAACFACLRRAGVIDHP